MKAGPDRLILIDESGMVVLCIITASQLHDEYALFFVVERCDILLLQAGTVDAI